tara:strand:+ start:2059 stop:3591 length:1533 start_codon:yes stop_codon:yes gene_type:complete
MAQNREHMYIGAPGFMGLNTQDSPVGMNPAFASVAEHAVIDQFGRIGARKGLNKLTSSASPLGSSVGLEAIFQYNDLDGTSTVFSAGNNKIFTGTTSLTDVTPSGYSPSANNWKIVNFNNHAYFYQKGHESLVYTDESGSGVLDNIGDHAHATGTAPAGNEVLAAFGRLWVADVVGNTYTLYFSDALNGHAWTGGSSGSLNVTSVWPNGQDDIVALASQNNFLIIFGKRNILVYEGATDPSEMTLSDTIVGIGCIARDSVQNIGSDILFLSDTGVRSLGRTIQEKSMPMRDLSKNVRDDMMQTVRSEITGKIKSVYSPENAFYLLSLPTSNVVFCFDTRSPLEDGSFRVTTWPNIDIRSFHRTADRILYLGTDKGISFYDGYQDDATPYVLRYYTPPMTFENPSQLKILKEANFRVIGGKGATLVLNWAYDYTEAYRKQTLVLDDPLTAEYGISEYNIAAEYSSGIIIDNAIAKTTGSGTVVTLGVDATLNNGALSIQELKAEALIGRNI